MWASTLINRNSLTTLLLLGTHVQQNAAQRFPNSSIDASYPGLTSGCATAVNPVLNCDDALADAALSFVYLSDARLTDVCTTGCSNSLRLARQNIAKACTAQTDVIADGETKYPATYVLDSLLWAYTSTCRKDTTSGAFCHAILRDWAMENSTELTKEQECSDCMLGVTQAELFSPFAYSNASAAELSSRASACGKPTFTVTEPKPYALSTTSPTATVIPSLRSKDCPDRYQVRAGDTCQSVSQAHNVSTFGLLYWNNLAVGCTDFPKAGRAVCLPSPCPIYTIQQNDTCLGIIAHHAPDYSMRQLRSWNMNINNVCSNLEGMVGDQICIGPPALLASVALPASTPTATPVATPVAVPTNAATGSNPKCGLWYTTISGDICSTISGQYSISLKNFYFLNPAVDNKCSNLQREVAYCVRPVGDITTYPSYDGAGSGTTAACDAAFPAATCYQDPATLPSVPFLEANATFARPTSASVTTASRTLSRTTHVPSPTAPGSRTDCLEYARYVTTGDKTMEKAINSCSTVAQYYGVTVDQLLEWNAILKPENCGLLPRYVYCAYVEGAVITDDPPASSPTAAPSASKTLSGAPPGPTQPGIAAKCNKYALQSGQQYCYDMATANGITVDQLYSWNSALNGDCSGMYPGYAYCVGVTS